MTAPVTAGVGGPTPAARTQATELWGARAAKVEASAGERAGASKVVQTPVEREPVAPEGARDEAVALGPAGKAVTLERVLKAATLEQGETERRPAQVASG
jgi:hypothetical protein